MSAYDELRAALDALPAEHQATARGFADRHAPDPAKFYDGEWKRIQDEWARAASGLDATAKARINAAVLKFGDERFVNAMESLGLRHHPALLETLGRIGSMVQARGGPQLTESQRLAVQYPSMANEERSTTQQGQPAEQDILKARYPSMFSQE